MYGVCGCMPVSLPSFLPSHVYVLVLRYLRLCESVYQFFWLSVWLVSWLSGCVIDVCTFLPSLPLTLPHTILTICNRDIESYKGDWTAAAAHTDKLIMRDLISDAKLSSPLPAASEFNKSPARKTVKDLNNGKNKCGEKFGLSCHLPYINIHLSCLFRFPLSTRIDSLLHLVSFILPLHFFLLSLPFLPSHPLLSSSPLVLSRPVLH